MDLVVALPVSWIPLVADYSRFSRSPRAAALGTGIGYALSSAAFFLLGVLALRAYGGAGPGRGRRAAGGAGRRGRAGDPGRRRGGRGVREHLLDRDLGPERAAPGRPAAAGAAGRGGRDRAGAGRGRQRVRAVPVPHRGGVRAAGRDRRGRLLRWPAGAYDTSAAAPARWAMLLPWAGRLRRVPADRADRAVGLAGLGGVLAARPGPARASRRPTGSPRRWSRWWSRRCSPRRPGSPAGPGCGSGQDPSARSPRVGAWIRPGRRCCRAGWTGTS